MYMEPIVRSEVRQAEPDVASRAAGLIVLPIALMTLALWVMVGCVLVGASVLTCYLCNAFRALVGADDYAGMNAVRQTASTSS
jgi:hypothetical protein